VNEDKKPPLIEIARRLDRLRRVPDAVLLGIVLRDGTCSWVFDEQPPWQDRCLTDRELAAHLCAGCPVVDECLELELRAAGKHTVGICGGLSEEDRQELFLIWSELRRREGGAQR
jgi:WhiB family redox-sensing transcriptional regulator